MSGQSSTYPGPTAPYNNPAITPQYYKPSRFVISDITLGKTTTVTTSTAHNYVVGQLVRLLVPNPYGAIDLNEQTGYVISIPSTTEVEIELDSSFFNVYINSPSYGPTSPQILAIGDINTPLPNASGRSNTQTTISGAFINISPS